MSRRAACCLLPAAICYLHRLLAGLLSRLLAASSTRNMEVWLRYGPRYGAVRKPFVIKYGGMAYRGRGRGSPKDNHSPSPRSQFDAHNFLDNESPRATPVSELMCPEAVVLKWLFHRERAI